MKYGRFEKAEKVLAKVVALGGSGEDWLGLGVAELQQEKWDKAEATLRGAQNLLPQNPFPALHLAKVYKGKDDLKKEREHIEHAIQIDPNSVDAWAYLFTQAQEADGDDKAIEVVEELAKAEPYKQSAAPYIALQGFYAGDEETHDKAVAFADKAVKRNENDPLAVACLAGLYGQKGQLDKAIEFLKKHEGKMARDVRLANIYFEALFQARQIEKVTALLNSLAGSPNREVKQFAIERSRFVAQYLQQQQQQLRAPG
jgi:tetratricopeptide (TPR) repeat protein